jgi:hypothetical protein
MVTGCRHGHGLPSWSSAGPDGSGAADGQVLAVQDAAGPVGFDEGVERGQVLSVERSGELFPGALEEEPGVTAGGWR